ncbi:bifunctional glutamate N-acetyltransferase/amino-acid acetyltransferase ArgJ [Chloroflexota bacterium]
MVEARISFITSGTVTSPRGFLAGATQAGIKKDRLPDLGVLYSETPCRAVGLFTANQIKAAPVMVTQERLPSEKTRAVVINSGCANASVGKTGLNDAVKMTELAAQKLEVSSQNVLVASTGVIGKRLPMESVAAGIGQLRVSRDGGHELARAIMTTDSVPKEAAVAVKAGENQFSIGGIAKGSGMIHPNLATLLCFLATDAAVSLDFLGHSLKKAMAVSLNMVSIDGDTSPNDMVLLLANGQAGSEPISEGSPLADSFQRALSELCIYLAKGIARDGEGATKLFEVTINGASSPEAARLAARAVVGSSLVKAAVHGSDPNWGRIMAAVGQSGVKVVESKIDLYIGSICLVKAGLPLAYVPKEVIRILAGSEVPVRLELNQGTASATAWGCDLSEEYVTINSAYTT